MIRLLQILGVVTSMVATGSAQQPPPDEWKWVNRGIAENCVHKTLYSESMQRDIGFSVYLPPSYKLTPELRFPVVYYLHGASGSEASSKEFSWAVEKAIKEQAIGEVIYVFPNCGHYSGYRDWEGENVKAETWLIRELIPYVDQTFRTHSDREGRALCGWSMGGGASLRFLTKYPEMFCAAASLSAAIGYKAPSREDTATHYLEENVERLKGRVGIWMAVGEDDFLRARNDAFSELLTAKQIEHEFHLLPNTGHRLGELTAHFHRPLVEMLDKHYRGAAKGDSKR